MKKLGLRGLLFASALLIITITVNAHEGIQYVTDHYIRGNNGNHQVTTQVNHADGSSRRSHAHGGLDIVFVVSNALLGFLLLRRVNNS
jgi:hypothetical protein